MKRLQGLLLLLYTLFPLFFFFGVAFILNQLTTNLFQELKSPIEESIRSLETLQKEAQKAQKTILEVTDNVKDNVEQMNVKVTTLFGHLEKITKRIKKVISPIRKFKIPFPKVPQLQFKTHRIAGVNVKIPDGISMQIGWKNPFTKLFLPFQELLTCLGKVLNLSKEITQAVEAVKKLRPLADNFGEYKKKFQQLVQQGETIQQVFQKSTAKLGQFIFWSFCLFLPWFAFLYLNWNYQHFKKAWSLLKESHPLP